MKLSFLLVGLLLFPQVGFAQFYTVKSDSARISPYRIIKKHPAPKKEEVQKEKEAAKGKNESRKEKSLHLTENEKQEKIDSVSDKPQQVTLLGGTLGKLEERLNVCLPLDFLKITSKYGGRKDPITQCTAFHDGIDLTCTKEKVYAMLPAVVKKVHRGNKGYGNYVVLSHGQLECLYGHLEEITVREKDVINAGTIVGISGNTGKSTGYHLHIRLRNKGKSVDPMPFILYLKSYIQGLNKDLSDIVEPSNNVPLIATNDLTLRNVYGEILRNDILFPKIVLSQAVLETGSFSSRVCREYNNLFGLRRRNGEYYRFDRWEDSVRAYRDYVQYKYKGGDYFNFLDRIGYAEDKAYTLKVRMIAEQIKQRVRSF